MRPIDADAALKALRKCQTYLYDARDPELKIELSSAEAAINNLPTIQPVATDTNVGNNSVIPNSSDAVSRQAAIDALDVLCQEHRYRIPGKRETYSEYNEAWQDALDRAEGLIFNLPTVQPEVLACGNGELVAQPEPTDIDAKEAVYNLAEKIGIHQLFALTVELRGEPIQPEPHEGRFERKQDGVFCSVCHYGWEFITGVPAEVEREYHYCPNCGADMRGEKDE